jgi:Cation transporting ATPase, C-terminus.
MVQFLIPAVPGLADAFRAHALDAGEWVVVAAIALTPALLAEVMRTLRGDRTWIA